MIVSGLRHSSTPDAYNLVLPLKPPRASACRRVQRTGLGAVAQSRPLGAVAVGMMQVQGMVRISAT